MLRRLLGLSLSLALLLSSLPVAPVLPTYAQDASPVAVDPDDTSDSGADPAGSESFDVVAAQSESVEPASDPGDTAAGWSVGPVYPLPDIYLTFGHVLTAGVTTAHELDSTGVPPLPNGYRLDNARIVHIETTATYEFNNIVCIIYNGANFADPSTITLFRLTEGGWQATAPEGSTSVASSTVCGYADGLGTFAAAEFATAPTPEPSDTATPLPTDTTIPTATNTVVPTASRTPTSTPSHTPTPSETSTSTATVTQTTSSTATETSTPSHTATSTPTATPSPAKTWTSTSSPTEISTFTATPTPANGQTQYAIPPNVWVTYSEQPPPNGTSGRVLDGSALPTLPSSYRVVSAWFFLIEAASSPTASKQICVLFDSTRFANPSSATLLRSNGTVWTLLSGQVLSDLDDTQGTLCGYTTALGSFVLAEKLPPTAVPTLTPSRTATTTATPSNTATTPPTWTPTATSTHTATPSSTPTTTPSRTPTPLPTETLVVTHTPSASPSATPTPTQSPTSTATATATKTSTATSTPTNTPSATSTPTLGPGSYPTGTILRVTTKVNLRGGPSTDSASLGIVPSGTTAQVTGSSMAGGGRIWVPVAIPILGTGWIAGDYLMLAPTPTPTRTPASPTVTQTPGSAVPTRTATRPPGGFLTGDYVKTTTSLNLRSAPGTAAQVVSVIPSGTIGRITGAGVSSAGVTFYPVLFRGRPSGYVAGNYLQRVTATPTPTRTVSPTATIAGVPIRWTNSNVNMRSGAGTGYHIVATLPEGSRVTITGNPKRSGGYDWYPVTVYGIGSGWIAGKFLSITWPT